MYYTIKHEAHDDRPGRAKERDWIQEQMQKRHSPAIILLLASMPRILLRMTFRPLRHGYIQSLNGFKAASAIDQKGAFHKLLGVYQGTPVNHNSFGPLEEYFGDVDSLIKSAYTASSINATQRAVIEREMFLTCAIPPLLMPVVTEMLTGKLETLMSKLDPGKIHIHDVSWLGLTDDQRTKTFREGHIIDVIRKMPLANTVKLKLCPRCGSVMENIVQTLGHYPQWVWQSQKVCVCHSSWVSPEE
jgi:mediator of RNA polymerase II transcription subunit 16